MKRLAALAFTMMLLFSGCIYESPPGTQSSSVLDLNDFAEYMDIAKLDELYIYDFTIQDFDWESFIGKVLDVSEFETTTEHSTDEYGEGVDVTDFTTSADSGDYIGSYAKTSYGTNLLMSRTDSSGIIADPLKIISNILDILSSFNLQLSEPVISNTESYTSYYYNVLQNDLIVNDNPNIYGSYIEIRVSYDGLEGLTLYSLKITGGANKLDPSTLFPMDDIKDLLDMLSLDFGEDLCTVINDMDIVYAPDYDSMELVPAWLIDCSLTGSNNESIRMGYIIDMQTGYWYITTDFETGAR